MRVKHGCCPKKLKNKENEFRIHFVLFIHSLLTTFLQILFVKYKQFLPPSKNES